MNKPLRHRAAAVVAGALTVMLLGVLAGCADRHGPVAQQRSSPTTATVVRSATTQRVFAAYDADGVVRVPVRAHTSGSCWTTSIAVPLPGAYRCLAGNQIEDPCFAAPVRTSPPTLACVPDPWSAATVITLTGALPASKPAAVSFPWALELANGARCVVATGTVPTVGGTALPYLCGGGHAAGIAVSIGPPTHVEYGALTATALTPVAITTIWQG